VVGKNQKGSFKLVGKPGGFHGGGGGEKNGDTFINATQIKRSFLRRTGEKEEWSLEVH